MRNLYRLLFCLFAFFPALSFAYPATVKPAGYQTPLGNPSFSTPALSCANFLSRTMSVNPGSSSGSSTVSGSTSCSITFQWSGATQNFTRTISYVPQTYTCPTGGVLTGSECVVEVDKCLSKVGTSSGRMVAPYTGGSLNTTMVNLCEPRPASDGSGLFPGCSITVSYDFAAGGEKSGTGTYGAGCTPGTGDGSTPQAPKTASTETAPIEGAPAPTPCKQGYASGTVNGKSVCIAPAPGSDSVTIDKKAVTATDATGNTLSGTQEKTTTCKDGTCTTSTTVTNITTNVDGTSSSATTSSGSTESQDSFCRANPNASQCDGLAGEGDGGGDGGGLPGAPELYEPKYPDGLSGVWEAKKAQMTSTPLFTLANRLMPTIGAGGTCPAWSISFDLGISDMGTHNVAPPCWIWDVAKAIVIVSALLLARALIFGG